MCDYDERQLEKQLENSEKQRTTAKDKERTILRTSAQQLSERDGSDKGAVGKDACPARILKIRSEQTNRTAQSV